MGSVLIGSIRGPRGDPGPKGEPGIQGIQGVPGPLPPLVNNYLPRQEGTAAADAAILHDIDSRIENTKDSLSKVALSGRAPDVETDEDHRFVTDDEKKEWNGKVDASGGDISETVVGTLDNITKSFPIPEAKEKPRTFLGKVRKNLQDWKNLKDTLLTLNRLVNNGQTTASGYALDARYGKTLYDLYAQLNSNLSGKANVSDFADLPAKFGTFGSSSDWNAVKKKGEVHIYIHLSDKDVPAVALYSQSGVLFTIPNGYRPFTGIDDIHTVVDVITQNGFYLGINAGGQVYLKTRYNSAAPGVGHVYASVSYRSA